MKKAVLILATLVFAVMGLSAQTAKNANPAQENPNAPEITFEKTVHDYGTVPYQGDGKCEFKFTNTGKEPLILTNVRSSCGCTVPKWPREPILPGQSEVIHVEYKTNRIGRINKTVTVQSNAKNPNIMLRIKGQVVKEEQTGTPENTSTIGKKAN
ncbi:MAG: DUF1573 domain-containing protein [Bacteroidota bacterium]